MACVIVLIKVVVIGLFVLPVAAAVINWVRVIVKAIPVLFNPSVTVDVIAGAVAVTVNGRRVIELTKVLVTCG
jgi:hypothetical protein